MQVWRPLVVSRWNTQVLLLLDVHLGHLTDQFRGTMSSENTELLFIPPSCSCRLQPLNVCVTPVLRDFLQVPVCPSPVCVTPVLRDFLQVPVCLSPVCVTPVLRDFLQVPVCPSPVCLSPVCVTPVLRDFLQVPVCLSPVCLYSPVFRDFLQVPGSPVSHLSAPLTCLTCVSAGQVGSAGLWRFC